MKLEINLSDLTSASMMLADGSNVPFHWRLILTENSFAPLQSNKLQDWSK